MTRGLESKLHETAKSKLAEIEANFERAERNIYPEYLTQFKKYRAEVLALLGDGTNLAVVDDPQVISAVEASNKKVISGLSNQAWNETRKRVRWVVREAANDNLKKINIAA